MGVWYRPPEAETESVAALPAELDEWREEAMGTLLVGDMNVYNVG